MGICVVFTGTTDAVTRGGKSTVWDDLRAKVCEKWSEERERGTVDTGIYISSLSEETSIMCMGLWCLDCFLMFTVFQRIHIFCE